MSRGGGLARAAYGLIQRAAVELRGTGTLGFLDGAPSYAAMQLRFRWLSAGAAHLLTTWSEGAVRIYGETTPFNHVVERC